MVCRLEQIQLSIVESTVDHMVIKHLALLEQSQVNWIYYNR